MNEEIKKETSLTADDHIRYGIQNIVSDAISLTTKYGLSISLKIVRDKTSVSFSTDAIIQK